MACVSPRERGTMNDKEGQPYYVDVQAPLPQASGRQPLFFALLFFLTDGAELGVYSDVRTNLDAEL